MPQESRAEPKHSSAVQASEEKHPWMKKAVSRRISVWGFADFELTNSPRGSFSVSLTSFPKKSLKREKMRDREKSKPLTGTYSLCFRPCKMTEGPVTTVLLYIP